MKSVLKILLAASTLALPSVQCAPMPGSGLLVISIDGLNPSYVIEADKVGSPGTELEFAL